MIKFLRKTALWIVLAPAAIWGTGLVSNQLVLMANHDTFPVLTNPLKAQEYRIAVEAKVAADNEKSDEEDIVWPDGYIDDTHIIMTKQTHLNFLADVFDMKSEGVYSVGDFLLMLGEWLWAFVLPIWMFEVVRRLRQE